MPTQVRRTLSRLSRKGELPTVPSVVSEAIGIAREPDADPGRLCRVIGTDVGIAARVLRIANSVIYGRRAKCQTLPEAVMTIGLRGVLDILSAAALRSLFDLHDPVARRLWNHALAVALAAEELAPRLGGARRGEAFLPALFHDLGRIVFFLAEPEAYAQISHLDAGRVAERVDLERGWYGFDHAEAGAAIAADWGLATAVCDSIRAHHVPSRATTGRALAELLASADALAYVIGRGAGERETPAASQLTAVLSAEDLAVSAERVRAAFDAEQAHFR